MTAPPAPPPRSRSGTSVIEVVLAFVLTALLLQATWSLVAAARSTAARLLERSEALETERVGWHVLLAEVTRGVPARDWGPPEGSTLPLRVFRGTGELCPERASPSEGLVRYRGFRLPEPDKDSLLLLDAGGSWHAVRLLARAPALEACAAWAGEGLERWSWDPPVPDALLGRVFERGSYHLEDRALRYRLGSAGRQPLTPERLDDGGSGFLQPSAGRLHLRVRVRLGDDATREWTRPLPRVDGDG